MAANGALVGNIPVFWMDHLGKIPEPPGIMSERIKSLLSTALTNPSQLSVDEIREIAASVVFHLVKVREEEGSKVSESTESTA